MTGRPTKLTDEAIDAFVQATGLGATRDIAAQCAGWSRSCALGYLEAARTARDRADTGARLTAKERRLVDFLDATEKAEGMMARNALALIVRAAQDRRHWTAAAWLLERRYPEAYGRRTEITGKDGGPVEVEVRAEDLLARLRALNDQEAANVDGGRRLRVAPTNGQDPAAS